MPRISFDCPSTDKWYEETGEGTSTFDVCTACFKLDSRELLSRVGRLYQGEPQPSPDEELTHDDTSVENPYLREGKDVCCDACGKRLRLNINY